MTDETNHQPSPNASTDPAPETPTTDGIGSSAAQIIETIKDAIDDLAERAEPTVRVVSARVAELTSVAAAKAAPLAKKAGEATAEGAEKLAEKSKGWAADVRQTIADAADNVGDTLGRDDDEPATSPPPATATDDETTAPA